MKFINIRELSTGTSLIVISHFPSLCSSGFTFCWTMKMLTDTPSRKSADYFYLISWLDCLERLDILLMEARHLQQSIIHTLREPVFYLPLRHEEFHLWGQGWSKEFAKLSHDSCQHDAKLARHWMLHYPSPEKVGQNIRLVPVDNSLIFINFMNRLRAKRTDSLTNRFFLLSIRPV